VILLIFIKLEVIRVYIQFFLCFFQVPTTRGIIISERHHQMTSLLQNVTITKRHLHKTSPSDEYTNILHIYYYKLFPSRAAQHDALCLCFVFTAAETRGVQELILVTTSLSRNSRIRVSPGKKRTS